MSDTETSPDVCYRHPKRASWVLCQRCGRTICPECQILAPVGVQCPECVRETGGSGSWRGAARPAQRRPVRSRPAGGQPSRLGGFARMLRPGSGAPVLSWGVVALVVVVWILSAVFGGYPAEWLVARPQLPLELWRYATGALVYPLTIGFGTLFSVLHLVFFLLIAPSVEEALGRRRFLVVLLTAVVVGNAGMVLSGAPGFTLIGALFGMFGAYLIMVWSHPQARARALVMLAINLLIALALGGAYLPLIVGGTIGGAGAMFLLQYYEHRRGGIRTAYLIIGAVVAGLVLLATFRGFAYL